jgi:hypothetical protein
MENDLLESCKKLLTKGYTGIVVSDSNGLPVFGTSPPSRLSHGVMLAVFSLLTLFKILQSRVLACPIPWGLQDSLPLLYVKDFVCVFGPYIIRSVLTWR